MAETRRELRGIPDKTYYRIGEVARITRVKPYVLRFWESEFKIMAPPKSRSKQRMYRRRDIETILQIKELLYDKGYTIKGARKRLGQLSRGTRGAPDPAAELQAIRAELVEIRDLLEQPGALA